MTEFLSTTHLSKTYPDALVPIEAIRDVSIAARTAEVLSIVGPSGCGKTTLLRLLAGLLSPSHGQVTIAGKPPEAYRGTAGIGFIPQKPVLFPWRTMLSNVLLPVEVRFGTVREDTLQRARDLIAALGLSEFERAYPRQLSGGMLQRASLARALVGRPGLLLLDEPLSAVDEIQREQIWVDFARLWRREGVNVVLATHSLREAVFLGDRVLVLSPRPGQIRQEFEVSLPQTRDESVLDSSEFAMFCHAVRGALA